MKKILVTGSSGFIGKNLCSHLANIDDLEVTRFDKDSTAAELEKLVLEANFIFHLAGVNRPENESEFKSVNTGLTKSIIDLLSSNKKETPILITSSVQALLDNPYGRSKKEAEQIVAGWAIKNKSSVFIYRLPSIFGKWCRPNYNSVVATFCHNIANDLDITINNPKTQLTLAYIDNVVEDFIKTYRGESRPDKNGLYQVSRTFQITLQELADKLYAFNTSRDTLLMPNMDDDFDRYLYATYLSYISLRKLSYKLNMRHDNRGWLAEFIKSEQFGQIFVSTTKPGVTRGNHWHHSKVEKFLVIKGSAEIKFKNITWDGKDVITYKVDGENLAVVDIPVGYSHYIRNVGEDDLITIFWANEVFDQEKPDTFFKEI